MKLCKVQLINFRGYIKEEFLINDITAILGKNDVGKSTLLEALDIFFNFDNKSRRTITPEPQDKNINSTDSFFGITCFFEPERENEKVIIDSSNTTTLQDEFMLNSDSQLEVITEWDCSNKSITKTRRKVYINANIPYINDKNYLTMNITNLKKELASIKDQIGTETYDSVVKTKKSEIRRALYNFYNSEMNPTEEKILISEIESDYSDIWKSLLDILPSYFLFQSDRSNTSKDNEVQTPLKAALVKALDKRRERLKEITDEVIEEVSEVGNLTIEKLREFDSNIARTLKPDYEQKNWDSLFSLTIQDENNIPLEKRGSGIRRLILLSYFRVEAEKASIDNENSNFIYAIEEPETSQHPSFQKIIFDSLRKLTSESNNQVILTSHTPEISKLVDKDDLILIEFDDERVPRNISTADGRNERIINSLGLLPTVNNSFVVCVEGTNDINFLTNINQTISEFRDLIDLNKHKLIPMRGSTLIDWINKDYLKNSNVLEFHLYDSDVQKYVDKVDEMNSLQDKRRKGLYTTLPEIENYIPIKLINEEFNLDLDESHNWLEEDIPKILISKNVKSQISDTSERERVIKEILNNKVSKKIKKQSLIDYGVYEEMRNWFIQMSTWCENQTSFE